MQFSLRDVILAGTIVALVAGWWSDRRRLVAEYESAISAFRAEAEHQRDVANFYRSQR